MTIYTFPDTLLKVTSINFPVMPMSVSSPASAFNPLQFQSGPTTELWAPNVTIAPRHAADVRELSALLRKLRGRLNKIRLFDPLRPKRGAGASGPTAQIAASAVAGATSVTIDGLTASQAVGLAADDLIGIGENLYAVSDDAPTDSGGAATVSILPPLRQGVADGDTVTLVKPTGLFLLRGGADGLVVRPGTISEPLTLDFIEAPDFD